MADMENAASEYVLNSAGLGPVKGFNDDEVIENS
jgi:hypothetical protein